VKASAITPVTAVAAMALLTVTIACAGDRNGSDSGRAAGGAGMVEIHAVQVAALTDSVPARRLADSLAMAGWQSYLAGGGVGDLYRVRVSPSRSSTLTEKVAFALRVGGTEAISVRDTVAIEPLVEAIRVNNGVHGMSARVRWMISPNGNSLILVHDPSGVEAEALPNGFVFVSERDGYVLQRDSVWDVAPNPSWTRIAFGQAFMLLASDGGGGDSVAVDQWAAAAAASGMPEDSVRANAFPISGMVNKHGYARPVIANLEALDSVTGIIAPALSPLLVSGGWRVRWTADSTQIALGDAPIRAQDDSPPRNWLAVSLDSALVRGTISQSRLVPLDWRLGPVLDISNPVNLDGLPMRLEGATITSSGGWVRRDGKIVGPGVALAATRDGRFIAALAPRTDAKESETPLEPVVYKVGR
jgi:hypothetical protein